MKSVTTDTRIVRVHIVTDLPWAPSRGHKAGWQVLTFPYQYGDKPVLVFLRNRHVTLPCKISSLAPLSHKARARLGRRARAN